MDKSPLCTCLMKQDLEEAADPYELDDDILLTSRQVWCRAFKNKSGNVFFIL